MAGWVAGQLARRDPPPRAVNKRQEASDREQATESKGQRARGREGASEAGQRSADQGLADQRDGFLDRWSCTP